MNYQPLKKGCHRKSVPQVAKENAFKEDLKTPKGTNVSNYKIVTAFEAWGFVEKVVGLSFDTTASYLKKE